MIILLKNKNKKNGHVYIFSLKQIKINKRLDGFGKALHSLQNFKTLINYLKIRTLQLVNFSYNSLTSSLHVRFIKHYFSYIKLTKIKAVFC